jgi:hypothetical protein
MRRTEPPGPGARMTSGCRAYSDARARARRAVCTARPAPTLSPGTASSCPPSARSPPGSWWRSYRPTQGLGGRGTGPGPSGCTEDGSCEPACALLPPEQRASHGCRSPGAGRLRFVAGGCCRFSTVTAGRSSTFARLRDDGRCSCHTESGDLRSTHARLTLTCSDNRAPLPAHPWPRPGASFGVY